MHKTILSFAALVAAAGFLTFGVAAVLHSVPESQAQDFGPVVTGGEAPFLALSGQVGGNTDTDPYTVPADRTFVMTGFCTNSPTLNINQVTVAGTTTLVDYRTYNGYCASDANGGPLSQGTASIPFPPGATIRLQNVDSSTRPFTLQGYLAAP